MLYNLWRYGDALLPLLLAALILYESREYSLWTVLMEVNEDWMSGRKYLTMETN